MQRADEDGANTAAVPAASSSASPENIDILQQLAVRMVGVEYTMMKPNQLLDDTYCQYFKRNIALVPVIDVYGATRHGQVRFGSLLKKKITNVLLY